MGKGVARPILITIFGAVLLLSAVLNAATMERLDWTHEYLEAYDGTQIELAYQVQQAGAEARTRPLWVHVTGDRLDGRQSVKLLFENYYLANIRYPDRQQMAAALNLAYSGDSKYSVELGTIPIWSLGSSGGADGFEEHFRQQLSISIDGQPLRSAGGDPVFKFQLRRENLISLNL